MSPAEITPRQRFAIGAIFVSHGMEFGTWAGSVPRLRELWALEDGPLGLVLLAVALGALAAMPVGGRLAARFGAARVAIVGGGLFALLLPAPALTHAFGLPPFTGWVVLLASAGLVGLAAGTMDIGMNAEASAVERRGNRVIMSGLHAFWSVGGLVGSGIAAGGAALNISLAATLAVAGAVVAVLVGGATIVLWRSSHPETKAERAATRGGVSVGALAALCVMAALCFSLEGALADWSGLFMRDVHGVSAAVASATFSGVAFAMVVARFAGDVTRRRIGAVGLVRIGSLVAAVTMAAILLVPSMPLALFGFAVVGFGLANVIPVLISAAGGRGGAAGIALVAGVGYAGLLAGPPIIGFTAQTFTLTAALWLVVLGSVALALLAGAVRAPVTASSTRASDRVRSGART